MTRRVLVFASLILLLGWLVSHTLANSSPPPTYFPWVVKQATPTPIPPDYLPFVAKQATPTPSATPTPTLTPTPRPPLIQVVAWVSNPNPKQNSRVTAYGQITNHGEGLAGVPLHTKWHLKTTTGTCDGLSGTDGVASCSRSIGRATIGYFVRIEVLFTYQGQVYSAETGFTPQ